MMKDVKENEKDERQQNMTIADLIKEQELLRAQYFSDDQPFILEVNDPQSKQYLSEQICQHYEEVSKALNRYMEIEDLLSHAYAKTVITVMGYPFTMATGLRILQDIEQVKRDPVTGDLRITTHPIGIFLSMCSVPDKYVYTNEPKDYVDPLSLLENTVLEDVCYKIDKFLIELKYAIENANYHTLIKKKP